MTEAANWVPSPEEALLAARVLSRYQHEVGAQAARETVAACQDVIAAFQAVTQLGPQADRAAVRERWENFEAKVLELERLMNAWKAIRALREPIVTMMSYGTGREVEP